MSYSTQYPEVEKMLRKYSKAPMWIYEKQKTIGEKRKAQREFELLSSSSLSGMPKGNRISDPTAEFVEHIEYLDESAGRLDGEIKELQKFVDDIEKMLEECLDADEAEIILLKYKERQSHKYIIWKKKISKRTLFNLLNGAYTKIALFCTKLH
jgi:hypothetical protein